MNEENREQQDQVFFRTLALDTLSPSRFRHTLAVEKMAVSLASRFGLDVSAAALAALTHDLLKELPKKKQVLLAGERGLLWYQEDVSMPQVLHGRLAADLLANKYGVKDLDLLNAVAYHTLGRPGMSLLEMTVYSADLLEEGRDFYGVDNLRRTLYDDLQKGTCACMEHTLTYLREAGEKVHPLTAAAYEDLRRRLSLDDDTERNA